MIKIDLGEQESDIVSTHYNGVYHHLFNAIILYQNIFEYCRGEEEVTIDIINRQSRESNLNTRTAKTLLLVLVETRKVNDETQIVGGDILNKFGDNLNRLQEILTFLEEHLESIISSNIPELVNNEYQAWTEILEGHETAIREANGNLGDYQNAYKTLLENIFSYERFSSKDNGLPIVNNDNKKVDYWDAYKLVDLLKVDVCPYCNRNFVKTIIVDEEQDDGTFEEKNISRADLDHFMSKSDYPLLRLSFYNLIPSCKVCNSTLKGSDDTSLENNIHPYSSGFDSDGVFDYDYENEQLKIILRNNASTQEKKDQIDGNNDLFKIEYIYNHHTDLVEELIKKMEIYNELYLQDLETQFGDIFQSKEEFYQFALGNFYSEADFVKRPFAKLMKDIYTKLETIYSIRLWSQTNNT